MYVCVCVSLCVFLNVCVCVTVCPDPVCLCFPQKLGNDWRPEIRLPHISEYVVLSSLDWNTEYEVHVVAENQQGKSQPSVLSFRTSPEPTTIPGNHPSPLTFEL